MKEFILNIFNGIKVIFIVFLTIMLIGAGIYSFCELSNFSGFAAVGSFIIGLLQLMCGVISLYCLGDTFKRGNNDV